MRNSIINSLVKNSVVVASFLSHAGCGFVPLLKGDGSKSIDYISLDYMRSKSKDLFDLGIHNEEGLGGLNFPKKNSSDSFEYIVDHSDVENNFIHYGIDKKVLDRLTDNQWYYILEQINYREGKAVQIIINTLKLATVTQALYDYASHALRKSFGRGSFSIQDKDEEFFKLFSECAQSLQEYYYKRDPASNQTSHYKDSMQYGVDMVLNPQDYPVEILPYGHHILFGSVKKYANHKATFVKCEYFGLKTWPDYAYHGAEFIKSQLVASDPNKDNREKDLPRAMQELKAELAKNQDCFIGCNHLIAEINSLKKVHDILPIIDRIRAGMNRMQCEATEEGADGFSFLDFEPLVRSYAKLLEVIVDKVSELQGDFSLLHLRTGNECMVPQRKTNELIKVLKRNITIHHLITTPANWKVGLK